MFGQNIVGKRIISWISNGEMILIILKIDFDVLGFRKNMIKQVNFLKKI